MSIRNYNTSNPVQQFQKIYTYDFFIWSIAMNYFIFSNASAFCELFSNLFYSVHPLKSLFFVHVLLFVRKWPQTLPLGSPTAPPVGFQISRLLHHQYHHQHHHHHHHYHDAIAMGNGMKPRRKRDANADVRCRRN